MAVKIMEACRRHFRLLVQVGFAALSNGYVNGYLSGTIYKGTSKKFCVPGLNCYSCPGALGACPIGSLQAVLNHRQYHVSFYVIGFLMAVGAVFGRGVCGFLCPFGLVQDLLHKIPWFQKRKRAPGERFLRMGKYITLAFFVILLPMEAVNAIGNGDPWFCKWICPSGTLFGGVFLSFLDPMIRSAIGGLFLWKSMVLAGVLAGSLKIYRPFCRYLCPLGAVYGFFNRISLYRFTVDEKACTGCGACQEACPMDLPVYQVPNSMECVRCGKCRDACPTGAIRRV